MPPGLSELVMKAMAVDKAKRFQTHGRAAGGARALPLRHARPMARIDAFLKLGTAQGCSDIHLAVGVPPMLRMYGDLMPIKFRDLGDTELESYVTEILTPPEGARSRRATTSTSPTSPRTAGASASTCSARTPACGAMFRSIPNDIPTLDSLDLPPIVKKLCDYHQGMILVTGSTGSGKSTTLAAMIDLLNSTPELNIISLEDPIEFVHRSKQAPGHPARAGHAPAVLRRGRCAPPCARTRT